MRHATLTAAARAAVGAAAPAPRVVTGQVDDRVLTERTFQRICALMHDSVGMALNASKMSLVASRLGPRLQRLGVPSYEHYLALLEDESEAVEFQMAVDLLTTNETYFFREPRHYEVLERELAARRSPTALAVWSAAASFGDEAYSTAMLLADLQQAGRVAPGWSVLATDISHRVLLSAREAVYPADRLRNVTPERLKRYCLRGEGPAEGQVMIRPRLREQVHFGQLNLCRPFSGVGLFDVIFLRNVLIYFDAETKRQVIDRVLQSLVPGGLFFIGTAEGRVQAACALEPIVPGAYRKPLKA